MNLIHFRGGNGLFNEKNELYSFLMEDQDQSPAQERKSTAILEAARLRFAKQGFEATKLSDVAKDSGVAVGTIYLRYKGKTELLAAVLNDVEKSFCDAMDMPSLWDKPFPQRFHAIVSAVLSTAGKQKDLAELMALSAFAPKTPASGKQKMLLKIEEHIKDGVSRGELRADLDLTLAARMAHGVVDGAMRDLMSNPARDPQVTVEHIADAYTRWLALPNSTDQSA